jgi:hypothetical protein
LLPIFGSLVKQKEIKFCVSQGLSLDREELLKVSQQENALLLEIIGRSCVNECKFFATGSLYDVPEDEAEHLVIAFQGGRNYMRDPPFGP